MPSTIRAQLPRLPCAPGAVVGLAAVLLVASGLGGCGDTQQPLDSSIDQDTEVSDAGSLDAPLLHDARAGEDATTDDAPLGLDAPASDDAPFGAVDAPTSTADDAGRDPSGDAGHDAGAITTSDGGRDADVVMSMDAGRDAGSIVSGDAGRDGGALVLVDARLVDASRDAGSTVLVDARLVDASRDAGSSVMLDASRDASPSRDAGADAPMCRALGETCGPMAECCAGVCSGSPSGTCAMCGVFRDRCSPTQPCCGGFTCSPGPTGFCI